MASIAQRVDRFQRRHRIVGFPLAVVYKFFDDQSNYLAATVTYYTFAAIFPLLLISSSVLGFLLRGNEALQKQVLNSALSQFPIVGTQLGTAEGIRGSVPAVVAASLVALYGVLGLGQAAQNAVYVAWAVPRNSRPNPFLSRFNSALLMIIAGIVVVLVATLTSVAANADSLGIVLAGGVGLIVDVVSILLTAAVFTVLMQFATPRREPVLALFPGALLIALLWQALQRAGSAYVEHVLNRVDDLGAAFAVPLGLLALIYVAANMAIIGVQLNVVIRKRLWPRALLTPFTDAVELTDADKRAYASYAKAQRHKGFETVNVTFDKETETPGDPAVGTSGEEVPGEEVPGEEVPVKEVPVKEVPGKEVPGKEVPGKEVPGEEVPGEQSTDGVAPEPAPVRSASKSGGG